MHNIFLIHTCVLYMTIYAGKQRLRRVLRCQTHASLPSTIYCILCPYTLHVHYALNNYMLYMHYTLNDYMLYMQENSDCVEHSGARSMHHFYLPRTQRRRQQQRRHRHRWRPPPTASEHSWLLSLLKVLNFQSMVPLPNLSSKRTDEYMLLWQVFYDSMQPVLKECLVPS